ncbi:DUF6716 putative glycosyltransferase [Agromyces silvae]|uniref:DUF6716 putative glycosyltransferase n=1 Tax=Agromyces silvae TaxID=3388266 RepID=UPI00280AFD71|nr:DUF6716 putative glycosyltransferase [Agromyces protaetiae]
MTGADATGGAGAPSTPAVRRLLVVSDSDSYTKWGAALASALPDAWHTELALLLSDVLPSERQLAAALAGSRWAAPAGSETDRVVTAAAARTSRDKAEATASAPTQAAGTVGTALGTETAHATETNDATESTGAAKTARTTEASQTDQVTEAAKTARTTEATAADRRMPVPPHDEAELTYESAASNSRSVPSTARPRYVHLDQLVDLVREMRADAVLLAFRGPLVRVTAGLLNAVPDRPVLIAGFPGLTIPAVPKAIIYREQVDLVVLHSRREVREFARLAADLPAAPRFGLATLPFLPSRTTDASRRTLPDGDVVFAVQAKVPSSLEERVHLVGVLAQAARRQPHRRFIVKVRARAGEAQTHAETYDLGELVRDPAIARELGFTPPPNLLVADGPMSAHLERAAALVTVSSTAVLEAIAADVPALLLDDYGVGPRQLNVVFEGSGLFGDGAALAAGAWRQPDPAWLDDNYFHGPAADDWVERLEELLAARAAAPLPVLARRHNRTGGALRRAFERRKMLGSHDRTFAGRASVLVAVPVRGVVRTVRRVRRALTGVAAVDPSQPVAESRAAERVTR